MRLLESAQIPILYAPRLYIVMSLSKNLIVMELFN